MILFVFKLYSIDQINCNQSINSILIFIQHSGKIYLQIVLASQLKNSTRGIVWIPNVSCKALGAGRTSDLQISRVKIKGIIKSLVLVFIVLRTLMNRKVREWDP
jgi:hypothetical protein